jgi:hypothetical protein
MGSRAFVATARAVLYVVLDPEDPKRRLLGQPRNNLGKSGDDLPTLAFKITGAPIETDDGPAETSQVVWTGTSETTIHDAINENADGGRAATEAREWLAAHMESLPEKQARSREIKTAAKRAGFKDRTLKRACQALGLVIHRVDFPRRTVWALPGVPVQNVLPDGAAQEEGDDEL